MEQKQVLKRIIAGAGRLVRGLSRAEKGGLAVILNYHSVHPEHPTSTKPGDFEAQMGLLAANFTVISLTEFCRLRSGAGPLPARCAAVTPP